MKQRRYILAKCKNTNTKLIFSDGLQFLIHSELTAMKKIKLINLFKTIDLNL